MQGAQRAFVNGVLVTMAACVFLVAALRRSADAEAGRSAKRVQPTLVVADFELFDFAPPSERYDVTADHHRIKRISSEVRKLVARSGMFTLLDRGHADESPPFDFHACRACIWSWAKSRGANFVIVGAVEKESRLILWTQMSLLDVTRRAAVASASLSMRDDSDQIWKAAGEDLTRRVLRKFREKCGRKVKGGL